MKADCQDCPAVITLRRIGGKWKIPILYYLSDRAMRFSELRLCLGTVAPKVLTEHLRSMEVDGLLTRKTFAEVPPRVEYRLTPRGRSLKPVGGGDGEMGKDEPLKRQRFD